MIRIAIAQELVKLARQLMAGRDRREVIQAISESKDKGIRGLLQLNLRIWNIDQIDWPATKKEMRKLPSGNRVIRTLESLPRFDDIVAGKYHQVEREMKSADFAKLVKQWESVGEDIVVPLGDEMVEYYRDKDVL